VWTARFYYWYLFLLLLASESTPSKPTSHQGRAGEVTTNSLWGSRPEHRWRKRKMAIQKSTWASLFLFLMSFRTDSNPQERVKNANNTVEYAAYESKMSKIQKASTVWRDGASKNIFFWRSTDTQHEPQLGPVRSDFKFFFCTWRTPGVRSCAPHGRLMCAYVNIPRKIFFFGAAPTHSAHNMCNH
jgi:hypothetical protein